MLLKFVGPFAFAYFLSYLFRVVNAVVGPGIVGDIGIDAGSLGLLTSAYFLAFAAAQVPLGVALDRYGPRLVESVLMVVAATGAIVFSMADSLLMLSLGRGLIGLGVSAALMGAFKAFSMVTANERLPAFNGIQLAAGALGALAGGAPAQFMMQAFGWRPLFVILAVLSLLSAGLIAILGPRHREARPPGTLASQITAVGSIMADPVFVRVALYCVPSQATALAILGLWAGPWLREVHGLAPSTAAGVLSAMAVAMMVGFLGFGALASRASARGIAVMNIALGGMMAFMAAQLALIVLPVSAGVVIWCLYALTGTAGVLLYPVLTAHYPAHLAGRVITALNFLIFVASFAIQWLTGIAIASLAPWLGMEGVFDAVFIVLVVLQAMGLVALLRRMPAVSRR